MSQVQGTKEGAREQRVAVGVAEEGQMTVVYLLRFDVLYALAMVAYFALYAWVVL